MENVPSDSIVRCEGCYKEAAIDDAYCTACGYPIKGTPLQQKIFVSRQIKAEFDVVKFKRRVSKAGSTLYYLAGIFILGACLSFFSKKDDPNVLAIVLPEVILAVLFLVLADYSKKKTLACFISGLCLFVITELLGIAAGTQISLLYMILVIVIIGFLVLGIKSAIEIERIKKENNIV